MTPEPTGKKQAGQPQSAPQPTPSPRSTDFDVALSNCIGAARKLKEEKMAALVAEGESGFSRVEEREDATARANLHRLLTAIISESGGNRDIENSLVSQAVERLDTLDRNYSERLTNYHLCTVVERDFPSFVEALRAELGRFDSEIGDVRSRIARITGYTLSGIDFDTPISNFGQMCSNILLHDDSLPDTEKERREISALVKKGSSIYRLAAQRIRALILGLAGSANTSEPISAIKTRMVLTYAIVHAARHDSGIWLFLKVELNGLNGVTTDELSGMNSAVLESDAIRRRARMKLHSAERVKRA